VRTALQNPLAIALAVVCLAPSVLPGQNPAPAASSSSTAQNAAPSELRTGPSLQDALYLYRTGRLDESIKEYAQLESGPQAALAFAGVTRAYLAKKDPVDAYASAAKAIQIDPSSADAKTAQGESLFRQGKLGEAEVQFVGVINTGANNARSYWGLARVSQAISYYAQQKKLIDRAHQLDPADPDITRDWIATLPLLEQQKYLKDYPAQPTNDDAETRHAMQQTLDFMEQNPTMKGHECRMTSAVHSNEVDLSLIMYDRNIIDGFGVPIQVNGVATKLQLDTGADDIMITRKTAEKAGVKKIFDAKFSGTGDKKPTGGYIGHADVLQIGNMEFHDCDVEVVDRGSVAETGLLGPQVFGDFLVELDLADQKMRLTDLPARPDEKPHAPSLGFDPEETPRFENRYIAPEMKDYTAIFRFGHMLLMPTRVNGLPPKLFLIDTGAFGNTISPEAAREVTSVVSTDDYEVKGMSAEVKKVYVAGELTLQFAHLSQKHRDIASFDDKHMSDDVGTEISGTLGFPMLRMLDMKIDYRDGLVSMTFDPAKFPWAH
jgi:predicted aspartyl protease/Tfp pilus assembly protein PilF